MIARESIPITCPNCQKRLHAKSGAAGKRVRCPNPTFRAAFAVLPSPDAVPATGSPAVSRSYPAPTEPAEGTDPAEQLPADPIDQLRGANPLVANLLTLFLSCFTSVLAYRDGGLSWWSFGLLVGGTTAIWVLAVLAGVGSIRFDRKAKYEDYSNREKAWAIGLSWIFGEAAICGLVVCGGATFTTIRDSPAWNSFAAEWADVELTHAAPGKSPPLTGKVFLLDKNFRRYWPRHWELDANLRPANLGEVGCIARLEWGRQQTVTYNNGVPGYRKSCGIVLFDQATRVILAAGAGFVNEPPSSILSRHSEGVGGEVSDDEIMSEINRLARRLQTR